MCTHRCQFGVRCVLCGLLPFQLSNNNEKGTERVASIFDRERNIGTGRDRLYRMFSVDEVGSFSRELITAYQATLFGAFVGATYGGFRSTKPTPEEIERRQILALTKKFDERVTAAEGKEFAANFAKGAFHWGWRVGAFCGSIKLISSAVSVYRGQSGILEYTAAGAIIGPLFRWRGGLKGMGAGGLVGIVVGTVAGCAVYATEAVSGTTREETMFWQHGWKETQLKHTKDRMRMLKEESSQFVENSGQEEHGSTIPDKQ